MIAYQIIIDFKQHHFLHLFFIFLGFIVFLMRANWPKKSEMFQICEMFSKNCGSYITYDETVKTTDIQQF